MNSCTFETLLAVMEGGGEVLSAVAFSPICEAQWATEFHGWFLVESSNSLRSSGARCDALTISLHEYGLFINMSHYGYISVCPNHILHGWSQASTIALNLC